jgi:hypothetical protein
MQGIRGKRDSRVECAESGLKATWHGFPTSCAVEPGKDVTHITAQEMYRMYEVAAFEPGPSSRV